MIRRARAPGVSRESRRVGRIGRIEWHIQVVGWAVRKAALGTRAPISLARSVLGTDPGQREESSGSGLGTAAATAAGVCRPPASPRLAGSASQEQIKHWRSDQTLDYLLT